MAAFAGDEEKLRVFFYHCLGEGRTPAVFASKTGYEVLTETVEMSANLGKKSFLLRCQMLPHAKSVILAKIESENDSGQRKSPDLSRGFSNQRRS